MLLRVPAAPSLYIIIDTARLKATGDPMRVHHRAFAMICRVPLDARRDTD
jgi:hypothetical protein